MSFWELLVILLVALIVIKPDRFPEIAYVFGRIVARIQRYFLQTRSKFDQWV